jgi:hypothetical protein
MEKQMFNLQCKAEKAFEGLGTMIVRHRSIALLISLAVAFMFAFHIPQLYMDMSTEGLLHKDDPNRVMYDEFRDRFGNDNVILLAIETRDMFGEEFLHTLKSLHRDLERETPYLDEVKSLINARNTYGAEDELVVEDLLEGWPAMPRDLARVRGHAMDSPLYRNMYLNEAGDIAMVVIKPVAVPSRAGDILAGFSESELKAEAGTTTAYLDTKQVAEIVRAVNNVVARYQSEGLVIHVAGWPVVENALVKIMKRDSAKFLGICIGLCALLLFILFRRPVPVVLCLSVVVVSFVSTLGCMAWLDIAYKIPSQVLPAFLTVVGIGDSVHIMAIFQRNRRAGMDRNEALIKALGHSGLAILLTSLTTAGGLLSFVCAQNAALADLGLYAGIGILFAFFYSAVLLPALVALLPARPPRKIVECSGLDRALMSIGRFSCRNSGKIIIVFVLLAVLGVYGAGKATYSHFPTKWLPRDMPERLATEFVDEHMAGSRNLEVIVDTHKSQGLHDPEILERLNLLARTLEERFPQKDEGIYVGKILSVVDVLKEIHQALNDNDPSAYAVPENARLIPQEFLLFENSGTDDLEDFVDTSFSKARLSVKVPDMDCTSYDRFVDEVTSLFRSALGPDVDIKATGVVGLTSHILSTVKQTQVSSLTIAVVVISLLMVLFMGNVRIGLIAMIPNVLPLIAGVGVMGLTGIPFDNATTMVATITLGIAVDDTIHFMHNFRRLYERFGNVEEAVTANMQTTGRAMLFTTLVLISGFMSYSFATLSTYIFFGVLLSFTMLVALMADFFFGPALLIMFLETKKHSPSTVLRRSRKCAQ